MPNPRHRRPARRRLAHSVMPAAAISTLGRGLLIPWSWVQNPSGLAMTPTTPGRGERCVARRPGLTRGCRLTLVPDSARVRKGDRVGPSIPQLQSQFSTASAWKKKTIQPHEKPAHPHSRPRVSPLLAGFAYLFFGLRVIGFDWFSIFGDSAVRVREASGAGLRSSSASSGSPWPRASGRSQPWARLFRTRASACSRRSSRSSSSRAPASASAWRSCRLILWYLDADETKAAFGENEPPAAA